MDAVLATTIDAAKKLHVVESVIAVGIADAIEAVGAATLVHHDVEAVESVKKAVRAADIQVDRLGLDRTALADGRQGDSIEFAVLVGDDEAALGVDTHGDPGAFAVAGDSVEQLELEILCYFDIAGGVFGSGAERFDPNVLEGNGHRRTGVNV